MTNQSPASPKRSFALIIGVALLVFMLALGIYSQFTNQAQIVQAANKKVELAQIKIKNEYEKVLADIENAKSASKKSKHDLWYIAHLEKTKLHLEQYLPKYKAKEQFGSSYFDTLLSMNLANVENIFMLIIMGVSAIVYMKKSRTQKMHYPVKPGWLTARYRQQATDSVAKNTYWQPLRNGGVSFQTHSLIKLTNQKLLLKSSGFIKGFFIVFLLIGINNIIFSLLKYIHRVGLETALDDPLNMAGSITSVGLVFIIVGLIGGNFLAEMNTLFDKTTGLLANEATSIQLNNIHALQIIEKTVGGNSRIFKSYELNVIKKDAERLLLLDHGNYLAINSDAEQLAEFLSVPIWENG